jgi:hypothetical protein
MKSIATSLPFLALTLALSACGAPPKAYYNRGDPENLIDVSSEIVNVGLNSDDALAQLAAIIKKDPPTRAELSCVQSDALCIEAKTMLDQHGVMNRWAANTAQHDISLVYERVVARDCENRYIDDSFNPHNLPSPTFGCSIMGNTVQMVSDKRQFVSPNLLDFRDADKAVQNYEAYRAPTKPSQPDSPLGVYPGAISPQMQ